MLAMLLSLLLAVEVHPAYGSPIYPQCGIIREIKDGNLYVHDPAGRPITIPVGDTEDWQINDIVSCIMWNNGTSETVYDDVPLYYRYSGFIREMN